MWAATDASLPWDTKDLEPWTELVTQFQPAGGTKSDIGHMLTVGQGWMPLPNKAVTKDPRGKFVGNAMPWENVFRSPIGTGTIAQPVLGHIPAHHAIGHAPL